VSRLRADSLLVLITLVWGTSFTLVQGAVSHYGVSTFLALRFGIAALVLAPLLLHRGRGVRDALVPGLLLGLLLFGGFYTQTAGLVYTTPTRSAFITGLCVVLVPVLGSALGQRPSTRAWLGVGLGFVGLMILSWGCHLPQLGCTPMDSTRPQLVLGDLLTLTCAVIFACHILAVTHYSRRHAALPLGTIQIVVVAALSAATAATTERPLVAPPASVVYAALFLGLVATAMNFTLQIALQRHTSATHAGLIYSLEPVFAAFCSWLWSGETLTAAVMAGGTLMLTGVVVAELGIGAPFETVAGDERERRPGGAL
jgi:drug/metabolite transporter (DMT)-like permease